MIQRSGAASVPLRTLRARRVAPQKLITPPFCWAILGVLAVGIFVPCILTWLHSHGTLFPPPEFHDVDGVRAPWKLADLALLQFVALIGCGPGALLLGMVVFVVARKSRRLEESRENGIMRPGALAGAVLAFANLPGYMCVVFYQMDDYLVVLRIILLFAVTGATCGAWIAWQAYRERHPERGFFPRFSLRTLIVGAFAWGLLLAVFMPTA